MTVGKPYFPILEAEIAKHGLSDAEISTRLGITERAFRNKLSGKSDFWWNEVLTLHSIFPDIEPVKLFSHHPDTVSTLIRT